MIILPGEDDMILSRARIGGDLVIAEAYVRIDDILLIDCRGQVLDTWISDKSEAWKCNKWHFPPFEHVFCLYVKNTDVSPPASLS